MKCKHLWIGIRLQDDELITKCTRCGEARIIQPKKDHTQTVQAVVFAMIIMVSTLIWMLNV